MGYQLSGGLTNYPNGVSSFGVPVIGSGSIPSTTGKYFFVSNNAQGSPISPFTSLTAALAACVSGRGDVIVVEPGYTETIGASGLTINKDGVSIIALGNKMNRCALTFGATAATITISAKGVLLQNITNTCSVDEVVTAYTITGAGVTLDQVDYLDTPTLQLIQFALVTGIRFTMTNCFHYQSTAAATAAYWISLGGADKSLVAGNRFHLTMPNSAASTVVGSVATAPLGITVSNNNFYLAGGTTIASAVLLVTSTTGMVTYNNAYISATSQTGTFALASAAGAQNFTTNALNKSGLLDPVADT